MMPGEHYFNPVLFNLNSAVERGAYASDARSGLSAKPFTRFDLITLSHSFFKRKVSGAVHRFYFTALSHSFFKRKVSGAVAPSLSFRFVDKACTAFKAYHLNILCICIHLNCGI